MLITILLSSKEQFTNEGETQLEFIKFPTENPRAFSPWDEWRLGI